MWKKIKPIFTNDLDLLFFVLYLWTIPFSWRKVLFVDIPLPYAGFNEYLDISIYLGDFFLAAAVLIFILQYYKYILSSIRGKVFHVEQQSRSVAILILISFSFISALWSIDLKLALFSALKLFEGIILFVYVYFRLTSEQGKSSTWNILRMIITFFLISGIFESLIGIAQVLGGKSVGINFLSESILSVQNTGVAKVIFFGEPVMRAYGTFLHPNILACFLLIAYFLYLSGTDLKMFHVEQKYRPFIEGVLIIGVISTLSKTAIFALFIGILFKVYKEVDFVPRGTKWKRILRLFHVEQLKKLILIATALIALIFLQNSHYLLQSAEERIVVLPSMATELKSHILLGLGSGQFVPYLARLKVFPEWQLQPIHNVLLLIFTEFGIIGTLLIFSILFTMVRVPRGTFERNVFEILLLIFLLSLFDHYLWDIESGRILLFLVFSIYIFSQYLTNKKLLL